MTILRILEEIGIGVFDDKIKRKCIQDDGFIVNDKFLPFLQFLQGQGWEEGGMEKGGRGGRVVVISQRGPSLLHPPQLTYMKRGIPTLEGLLSACPR